MNLRPVDFLIAGTQKGGTTALDGYLRHHPEIVMPQQKEVHFFDNQRFFTNSPPDYAVYHMHFPQQGNQTHCRIGDATPIYMYWEPCAARIHAYQPAMQFIILLRNPIDRAYSHWNMERQRGKESLGFSEAIRLETTRLANEPSGQHRVFSYIDRGYYSIQLKRLWQLFPREQFLILTSDALKNTPTTTLQQITDFLDIPPFSGPQQARTDHALAYTAPMLEIDRAFLRDLFAQDVAELEKMLGWDCAEWLR